MKRVSILLFALITTIFVVNAQDYQIRFSQENYREYQVSFSMKDWGLETFKTENAVFQKIVFSSSARTIEKGWAEIPFVNASIQLPAGKNVDMSVEYTDYQDFVLDYPILPSRGVISRSQDPALIPFEIDSKSVVDGFYPFETAITTEPFIIRDVRGTTVSMYPFQWNAVTNTLRVYTEMTVVLTENSELPTNPLLNENPNPIREVRGMYKSIFLNYTEPRIPLTMAEYGDILVITTARDEAAIQPYIDWKKEKGYNVEKEVVATGTNVKNLVKSKYDANTNLMYVLLVGGWNDLKSDIINGGGTLGSGPNDPMMGDVVTVGDNRPDVSIGRMAANSAEQVTIQVNKAIKYEKNPNMEPNWREAYIGVGSNQGPGDDNEYDNVHLTRIYTQRLQSPTFTYNTHYQNYGASPPVSTLIGHINAGASTIAYTGHGSETSWSTTGMSNGSVNALTNGDKLPFIVSVACLNGAFHNSYDCFAEAWLKKLNGGAVVTWMSSISQPWDPPMRGEDYFYDILIGGFNYNNYPGQNGINTNEQRTTWGSIAVNAANLMLSEVNQWDDIATVRTWCTFGDPALQLRTKIPASIESSNSMVLHTQPFETIITSGGNPVANAMVCISQNGAYYSGITDGNGEVSIPNECEPGEVLLVVTAFNTTTIYENIDCIPLDGPFVMQAGYEVLSGDDLTYISDNCEIAINLKNVGSENANGILNVTISCEDTQITIINPTAQCENIEAGEIKQVNFNVTIANDIVDKKGFPVIVTVTDSDENEWVSKITLTAFAPKFKLEKVLINGSENGNLETSSLVEITVTVKNEGNADAFNISSEIASNSPYVFPACSEKEITRALQNLPAGESIDLFFKIITSPDLPYGHQANIDFVLFAKYGLTYTASFTASHSGSDTYCATGSSNCSLGDKFTLVQLYKTSTPTVFLINKSDGACSSNGYENYTNIVATLEQGQQYTIKVKVGYNESFVGGWFDLNGNNIFESTERLITLNCPSAGVEYSQNFTIPLNAQPGTYRFRLRDKWNSALGATETCEASFTYGQTHDYTIFIPEIYPRVQNVVAELLGSNINLSWDAPEEGDPEGYNVYRDGNKLNTELLDVTTFVEEGVDEGIFAYNVKAVYAGNNESFAEMSNVICFFEVILLCEKPVNIEVNSEQYSNSALITWKAPQNVNANLLGYNIFRNEVQLNEEPITDFEYLDEDLENGNYDYQVSAVYEHCESELTSEVPVKIYIPQYCEPPLNVDGYSELYDNRAVITWGEPENIDQILLGYNIYRDGNKLNYVLRSEREYIDEELENGTYTFWVSAIYDYCEETEWSEDVSVTVVIHVPQFCEEPVNLELVYATCVCPLVLIMWDEPENIDQILLGYNVYRNDDKINDELVTELSFEDEREPYVEYTYQVSSVYDYCGESVLSEGEIAAIYTGGGSINTTKSESFRLFPNPASDYVTITAPGLNRVEIFDLQGRKLTEYVNVKETLQINDLKKFDKGIYLVKMYSETNIPVTIRLTIIN